MKPLFWTVAIIAGVLFGLGSAANHIRLAVLDRR